MFLYVNSKLCLYIRVYFYRNIFNMLRTNVPRKDENAVAHIKWLVKELNKASDISVTATKAFDAKDDKEKIDVLTIANNLSRDLQKAVYDLQQVSISYRNEPVVLALLSAANQSLSELVEHSSHVSIDDIKQSIDQIVKNVEGIRSEAEGVSKLNEADSKFQHKHQLVIILSDLLNAIKRVSLRLSLQRSTLEELKAHILKVRNNKVVAIETFTDDDPAVVSEVVHLMRHSLQQLLEITEDVDLEADNYDGESRNALILAAAQITDIGNKLRSTISFAGDLDVLKAAALLTVKTIPEPALQLADALQLKIDDRNAENNFNNLALTTIVNLTSSGMQFTQALENFEQPKL